MSRQGGEFRELEVERSVQTNRKPARAVEESNTQQQLWPLPAGEQHPGQQSQLLLLQTTQEIHL